MDEVYQDIIIDGEVQQPGVRECASRYESIRTVLERFQCPFTVLDIGANYGYFGFRIAYEFPEAVVVMVESPRGRKLADLAERQSSGRIVVLDRRVTGRELSELANCEHFDVVLALNVLHHMRADWRLAADSILRMAWQAIIETPDPGDDGACGQGTLGGIHAYLSRRADVLSRHARHTGDAPSWMFRAGQHDGRLIKPYFDAPAETERTFRGGMDIECDWRTKVGCHAFKREKNMPGHTVKWLPGINLHTYLSLSGIYPRRETIAGWLRNGQVAVDGPHGDLEAWNMILDGDGLTAIDPKPQYAHRDEGALERIAEAIECA